MKRLINIALLLSLFFAAPLIGEQVEELYWIGYASTKVEPVTVKGDRVGTTFQLKFEDEQYTMTNLHICRIPNILKLKKRRREQDELDKEGRVKAYPPLRDNDLIGEYITVGGFRRQIIALDTKHDLCILEGNYNLPAFDLASGYSKGELVRVIGYPRGLDRTLRKGRIFGEGEGWMPWLPTPVVNFKHISTLAYPGNSGSPVINKYGNLVGVLFAGRRGIHTEALIVPLEDVKNFLYRSVY